VNDAENKEQEPKPSQSLHLVDKSSWSKRGGRQGKEKKQEERRQGLYNSYIHASYWSLLVGPQQHKQDKWVKW